MRVLFCLELLYTTLTLIVLFYQSEAALKHLYSIKRYINECDVTWQELDSQPGDPKWLDVIEKDLHRQFPFHEMFVARGGHGYVTSPTSLSL